jgi:hypothetical protein
MASPQRNDIHALRLREVWQDRHIDRSEGLPLWRSWKRARQYRSGVHQLQRHAGVRPQLRDLALPLPAGELT